MKVEKTIYIYIYYPLSLWCICRPHAPNDMIGQIIYEKILFYQVFAWVSWHCVMHQDEIEYNVQLNPAKLNMCEDIKDSACECIDKIKKKEQDKPKYGLFRLYKLYYN